MNGSTRLERGLRLVEASDIDGWLIADFRRSSPVFSRMLGLERGILTRRCFLWLPRQGTPRVLASQVDGHTFAGLDLDVTLYAGFAEMCRCLQSLVPRAGRVAMEYVERGALPTVSCVDAGLIDLIREMGVTVVSSGTLIAGLEEWDETQRTSHQRAAKIVDEVRRAALDNVREALQRGTSLTEGALARFILEGFDRAGMEAADGPDVAVGAHSADPHYGTGTGEGATIAPDAVLLIDLWARARGDEDAPYADSTWMAYTGATPPGDLLRVFDVTRAARDRALSVIEDACKAATPLAGCAVDRQARTVIEEAGLGEQILHRTGHSLGTDHVHGMGTNLDAVEFPDDRPLLPGSGFTVEPGIYLPGQFGVRLEVSALLTANGLEVTTERQDELTLLR